MQVVSERKFVKLAPRKVRLVADAVKKVLDPDKAIKLLTVMPKAAAIPIRLTIKTALADAESTFKLDVTKLKLKNIIVNEGPVLKRFNPISRGSAHPYLKRTSHIKVILEGE